MFRKRPPKKSDSLVVRIPHETKKALLDASRAEGRSASEVVRTLIDGYLGRAAARARLREHLGSRRSLIMIMKSPLAQGGAIAAGLGAVALFAFGGTPSVADIDYRAAFERLDADGDGRISFEEYQGAGSRSTVSSARPASPTLLDLIARSRIDPVDPASVDGAPEPARVRVGARDVDGPMQNVVREELRTADGSSAGAALSMSPSLAQPGEPVTITVERMIDMGFVDADADGDGAVDYDEFVRRHETLFAEEFARIDANGDQRLSARELAYVVRRFQGNERPQDALAVLDEDEDGALSPEEFAPLPTGLD